MARPRTFFELNRLAQRAQARETARDAARRAATPAPYVPEPPKIVRAVRSIESDDLYVRMFISQTAWNAISTQAAALGLLTEAAAEALAGASVVNFEGNNDEVLRIRVNLLKTTPTVRMTSWGSRVVDKIDSSFSFPVGVIAANNSISAAKVQFNAFFAGAGNAVLGQRVGSFAQLIYRGKIVQTYVKAAAA